VRRGAVRAKRRRALDLSWPDLRPNGGPPDEGSDVAARHAERQPDEARRYGLLRLLEARKPAVKDAVGGAGAGPRLDLRQVLHVPGLERLERRVGGGAETSGAGGVARRARG